MQPTLVGKLIGMFVDRIISEVFANETGAARLQQVGLFTLIFVLEQRGETVTAARLAELTGQSLSAVYKQLEKLETVDVIERRKASNKLGRSYVYQLWIKHNDKTKRLITAVGKLAKPKVRGRRKK